MTRFVRRAEETGKELSLDRGARRPREAGIGLDRVDAVCLGSAPDAFDGVHRKGDYLADGAGAWGKPFMRAYVGGGTGVFTPIQGWYTVASGMADVVLCVAEEKMSSCRPHPQGAFLTIFDNIIERPLEPNLLWIFALEMHRYMHAYGLEKRDIAEVAVKNKRNAADHPAALLGQADITVEDVLASEVLAWPVQRLDVSPISDGAVALVLASEDVARTLTDRPVWIQGVGWNLDTTYWTNRDLVVPRVRGARRADGVRRWPASPSRAGRSTWPSRTTRSTTRSCTTSKGCCCSTRAGRPRRPATASRRATATCRAPRAAGCSASGTRSPPPGS